MKTKEFICVGYKKLKYTSMENWYQIKIKDFTNNYGCTLLKYYKNSPILLVTKMFNKYEWLYWKFQTIEQGWWKKLKNQRTYMYWLYNKLNFKCIEDFYKIKYQDFHNNYGVHYYHIIIII